MKETAEAIFEDIRSFDTVILFGHKDPDGDCVGSTRGFAHLLRRLFPKKTILVRSSLPKSLPRTIAEQDEIPDAVFYEALGILLDLSDIDRAEDQRVHDCKKVDIIDHHVPGKEAEGFLAYRLIDAPSCTFVLDAFCKDLSLELDAAESTLFFMGLVTDTERFLIDCRKEAFLLAADLVSKMQDPKQLFQELYRPKKSLLAFRAFVYTHCVIDSDICYLVIHKEEYLPLGLGQNEVANEVSSLLGLDGTDYAVFFLEKENGKVRVEFRSNGEKDVEAFARAFGGGGHHNASGCLLESLAVVPDVLARIRQ